MAGPGVITNCLLADFHYRALAGSQFEGYGTQQIIRDLSQMPGKTYVLADPKT